MKRTRLPEKSQRLGAAIRERRTAAGLSQEELAERIGCHRNYVGYVERAEHNVTYEMLCRFADGFKCGVAELISPVDCVFCGRREDAPPYPAAGGWRSR